VRARPRVPTDVASLEIRGLRISVLGWQFPEATDDWDSNWLRISATYAGSGSRVELSGSLLDTVSFARFAEELASMQVTLAGSATLASVEPNLELVLRFFDRLGHIEAALEMTADNMVERHSFKFRIDQSDLPQLIRQLEALRAAFPVRGQRKLGV
jgi:hypothetical protein